MHFVKKINIGLYLTLKAIGEDCPRLFMETTVHSLNQIGILNTSQASNHAYIPYENHNHHTRNDTPEKEKRNEKYCIDR